MNATFMHAMRNALAAVALLAAIPLAAAQGAPLSSHGLLSQLQAFLHERNVEPESLTPAEMVAVMVDWYRFSRAGDAAPAADALVFRYGGWSEGCATAFNLSMLRKMKSAGAEGEAVAGITMMFEPSGQVDLKPFASTTSDWKTVDEFMRVVGSSPAFRLLGEARPMSVQLESGGLR